MRRWWPSTSSCWPRSARSASERRRDLKGTREGGADFPDPRVPASSAGCARVTVASWPGRSESLNPLDRNLPPARPQHHPPHVAARIYFKRKLIVGHLREKDGLARRKQLLPGLITLLN